MFSVWEKGLCRDPSRFEAPQPSKLNVGVKNLKGSRHRPFSTVKKCEFFFFRFLVFVGLAYQRTDFVFRFIIQYGSLRDFGS